MATYKIKLAGEGLVAPAHRLADPGPTSGSARIYEITCPDGVTVDEVITAFKARIPQGDRYELDWADLQG